MADSGQRAVIACSSRLRHCGDGESAQLAHNTFKTPTGTKGLRLVLQEDKRKPFRPYRVRSALAHAAQRSSPWAGTGGTLQGGLL